MKIATTSSNATCIHTAVQTIHAEISQTLKEVNFLLIYYTESQHPDAILREIKRYFPQAIVMGCSSCQGIMTPDGYQDGHQIGVWAVEDQQGRFGTSLCPLNDQPPSIEMVKQTLQHAIAQSQRPGELPALIILHATTGNEEIILHGIREELGVNIPIIGGSAADNHLAGNWSILNQTGFSQKGFVIGVMYPTASVSYSFHSGYADTGLHATVTDIKGRTIMALNGQPAATVYSDWFLLTNQTPLEPTQLFAQSALFPLGRPIGEVHSIPYFSVSHPAEFTPDGGIEMFCNLQQGETVHFMSGTKEILISRVERVVHSANAHDYASNIPIGGIGIYCAGCMLQIQDALDQVARNMGKAMYNAPFICPFTYGEQGQFLGGEIAHGNLMISAVLFHHQDY